MEYLQVDSDRQELIVLPKQRDWTDFRSDKHLEYHKATLMLIDTMFTVRVDASTVPYAALMHMPLFVKVAKFAREHCKNKLKKIVVANPSKVTKIMFTLLTPLIPTAVAAKVEFIDTQIKKSL